MVRFIPFLILFLILSAVLTAAPGDTLKTIATPGHHPQGLTFDGKNLWCADRNTDYIYKIDPADGIIRDSIKTPGYMPVGLTFDGKLLWCVDGASELIYAINPDNQIVEKTIWCPVSKPGDLAWDGQYLWISDDGDNMLHQISPEDGTTILSIPAPSGAPGGLTWDGRYLWSSDRVADCIYMVTPDKGDVIIVMDSPGQYPCGLAWDGANVWDVDYQSDRISQLVVDDGTPFVRLEERRQKMEFFHQVRNFGPDTLLTLDVYLAIPENRNNQELLEEIVFEPKPTEIISDRWGQKVAHFRFTDVAAEQFTEVKMKTSAALYKNRYFVFPDKVGSLADIPADIQERFLADDIKYSLTDPIITGAVKKVVGDETNPYWIARNIYNYLIENMEYELAGGWNIAPTVLDRGNGSCSEYSFVYIAMCRAAGLPARYVGSVVVRGDDASWDNVFHRWVEVYLPGFGWLPVDPSGGDSPRPSHRANYFGFLNNRYLITTAGGGGSEYLDWSYNGNEKWTSRGRCKVEAENFGEWEPIVEE